jgi:hypothetical protein
MGLIWRPRTNGLRWVGSDAGLPVGDVGHSSVSGVGPPDQWHATRWVESHRTSVELGWYPSAEAAMVAVDDSLDRPHSRRRAQAP